MQEQEPAPKTLSSFAEPTVIVREEDLRTVPRPEEAVETLRRMWMCPICEEWIPRGTALLELRWQRQGGWSHRSCLPTAFLAGDVPSPVPPEREREESVPGAPRRGRGMGEGGRQW